MTRPAHDERILARIEAELRRSDPRLVALFDRLAGHGRRGPRPPAQATWRRLRIALLLTVALALGVGQVVGWQACRAEIARFDGRAVAAAQAQLHDWRQEIQALVWGSPPP